MTDGIVIIGAGHAGVSAAFAARDAGWDARITLIGDDPEWPYERPPLSKWDGGEPAFRPIVTPDQYQKYGIKICRGGVAMALRPNENLVIMAGGQTLKYSKLLLATGSRPRVLEQPKGAAPQFSYLRNLSDARALSGRIQSGDEVLIIGGGFIGLELAASLRARDVSATIIEAQDRLLARALPPEISERVGHLHEVHGVRIHRQSTIVSFQSNTVTLSNGQSMRADHVIVGIGSQPNTDLAAEAGLQVENGIVVDACFATSKRDIFAAGDCCIAPIGTAGLMRQESWAVAGDQGRRAGQAMAGNVPDPAASPWFWSDQFDHSLQVVGTPQTGTERVRREVGAQGLLCVDLTSSGRISQAAGIAIGNAIGREIKLIRKLIEKDTRVTPDTLSDPDFTLKSLLKRAPLPC